MKKAIISFLVFLIIDFLLFAFLVCFNGGKDFVIFFLPAIFIEIAFYGSFIIFEITNRRQKND